ncbi:MAG: efflux RND transporter permease subunit [Pseudomonadota bacterium]
MASAGLGTRLSATGTGILGYFTRHKTVANLLLVLMLVSGLVAFPQMRAQFFPDVIVDDVTVYVSWDGAGPEDVDRAIVQILGPQLLAVEGVTSTNARAFEGAARINMEFEPGWDMAQAADDVASALESARPDLPAEADDPETIRSAWRDRVADIIITGPVGVDQLGRFADEFVLALFAEGVTRTTIRGLAAPSTVIEVPFIALRQYDVTMAEIAAAIAEEAEVDPAGDVSAAGRVSAGIAKRTAEDIAGITLRSNADGSKLTVGDVARVREEGIDRERAYFVGENPAISIRADRSASGDAIELQRTVEEVAAEFQATLPTGTSIDLIRSRAEAITGRLNILFENGLMGLALVVGLLFLFLNARTAFWVAAGIPVAMSAAIAIMFAMGLTINMISLFALIITLGIVVDDAIVVGEHADYRARDLGEPPVEAAENAARRMFTPVFSATITTIIAFFGLTVIEGRFGDFVAAIPYTVIAVLAASLIECFLILPNHMSHSIGRQDERGFSIIRFLAGVAFVPLLLGALLAALWTLATGATFGLSELAALGLWIAGGLWAALAALSIFDRSGRRWALNALGGEWYDWPSRQVNRGFSWFKVRAFRPFMAFVVRARYPVLALAIVVLASQIAAFIQGDVRWRFFNAPERASVTGNFAMLPGATREDSLQMMREMQRATEELGARYEAEHGVNPILYAVAEVGGNTGGGLSGTDTKDPDQLGSIAIELIDADSRPYSAFALVAELQDSVVRHPLVETISFRGWRSSPGGDALSVQFSGADPVTLKSASEALQTAVAQFPEVSAVSDTLSYDKEEFVLELTPQGRALGFTIDGLARTLRNRLSGVEAASFPDGPRSATIRVELPETELSADFIERMELRTPEGAYVALSDIVSVDRKTGFATIRRENGIMVVAVNGDISEDDPERAQAVTDALGSEILPDVAERFGVEYRLAGLAEQERDFLGDATRGLVLCLAGIFLTLAWIFSSWSRPIVVMSIIPFGLIGTIYGHAQWDVPLSMFSVIGILGMVGIIINDSIVLVTTIDDYAKERGIVPAIIDGATDRLRPVLLTTLTTVLGLAPLLFEGSVQAEFLKPTVITLVYGLGAGMFLVLLVVPAMLAMQEDVASWRRAARRSSRALMRRRGWALGLGVTLAVGWLGVVALFAATLGAALVTGAPFWAPSMLLDQSPLLAGLAVFALGSVAWVLVLGVLGAIAYASARRAAGA